MSDLDRPMILEVSLVSQPSFVFAYGPVPAVPAVGDFVSSEKHRDLFGYVKDRRWNVNASHIVVRVWLQKDPP